jgi:hypothetical protein
VTEEPEKVLVKNRVSTGSRIVKAGVEVTVCQKSCNCSGKNWQRKKQKKRCNKN